MNLNGAFKKREMRNTLIMFLSTMLLISTITACSKSDIKKETVAETAKTKTVAKASDTKIADTEDRLPPDFRSVRWGMSIADVKEAEKNEQLTNEEVDYVAFSTKVAGFETVVAYTFIDNKLASAGYVFFEEHTNDNDYISDFNSLKKILTDKYGKPSTDRVIWFNSTYKDDPEHYGFAVSFGHLAYNAEWQTDHTAIRLTLSGENLKTNLSCWYSSKELYPLLEAKDNEKKKDKF